MTERERLVDLIEKALFDNVGKSVNLAENLADHLLKNGVIVLPCKVGDTVYEPLVYCDCGDVLSRCYTKDGCKGCVYHTAKVIECKYNLGDYERLKRKEIFLTREEAEKALKERENHD